jgi:prepilin-type processing-associated H-X9-DG protein
MGGFTVVELLVAISVIGLLLALLLPAVSSAREASRRSQCASHLRQIGVAISAFESQYGSFPQGLFHKYGLLPFLDLQSVHDAIGPDPKDFPAVWKPITGKRIEVYLCPSESAPEVGGTGEDVIAGASYAACFGSGTLKYGENGIFPALRRIRARDVLDGLSSTVAMSEFRRGTGQMERLRAIWQTPKYYSSPDQLDEFANDCDSIPLDTASYGWLGSNYRGFPWWDGDRGNGLYNHALTPNRPSCRNFTHAPTGIYTAGSLHPGGVNALYADGHVAFVSNEMDRSAWRSAGSRSETFKLGDLFQ